MRRAADGGGAGCRAVGADRVRGGRQRRRRARARLPRRDTYLTYFGCDDLLPGRQPGPAVRIGSDGAAPLGQPQLRAARARRRHRLRAGPPDRLGRRHHRGQLLRPRRRGRPAASPTSGTSPTTSTTGQVWAGRADLSVGCRAGSTSTRRARRTPGSCWTPRPATRSTSGRHGHHRRLHRRARRRAGLHAGRPRVRRRGLLDRRAPVRRRRRGHDVRPRGAAPSGDHRTPQGRAPGRARAPRSRSSARPSTAPAGRWARRWCCRPDRPGRHVPGRRRAGLGRRRRRRSARSSARGDDHLPLVPRRPRATPTTTCSAELTVMVVPPAGEPVSRRTPTSPYADPGARRSGADAEHGSTETPRRSRTRSDRGAGAAVAGADPPSGEPSPPSRPRSRAAEATEPPAPDDARRRPNRPRVRRPEATP